MDISEVSNKHHRDPSGKLRVTIISAEYPPFVQGGLGVHYRELVEELKPLCAVTVVAARTSRHNPGCERDGGLTVYRVKIPRLFPLNHIVFNLKAWWLNRSLGADVVHLCAPFGLLCLVFKKSPTVVKIHSLYKAQGGRFLYRHIVFPTAALMDRFMINRADLVMTTSEFMKKSIISGYEHARVVSINNGLNHAWLEAAGEKGRVRAGIGVPAPKYVILNVGRYVPRKGTLELLRAFRQVHRRHPQAQLVLIGSGFSEAISYEKQLRKFVAANSLAEAVMMLDWMPAEQVKKYYDAADLYVHAASYEPFGNVIVEAMASGLPVIAVKGGGPEEVAAGSAVILKSNNPDGLAAAINEFIVNPARVEEYAGLSRKRASTFSWKQAAAETLAGYKSILAS